MNDIKRAYDKYEGEFVVDIVVALMPADGKVGEEIDAPCAQARFGKFDEQRKTS